MCTFLGILKNQSKDVTGTIAIVLSVQIDTIKQEASLDVEKLAKVVRLCQEVLAKKKITLKEA